MMKHMYNNVQRIPIAAIDAGKFNFKFLDHRNKVDIFRTKMDEVKTVTPKMEYMKYNGKLYNLGNEASSSDSSPSKATLTHKLNIYYALIRNGYSGVKVNLSLGTPMKYFQNPIANQEFIDYIREDGKVEVEFRGQKHTILINHILVLPESSGMLYNGLVNYQIYSNKYFGLIDIGGLDAQGCIYSLGAPQLDTIMNSELGSNKLMSDIVDRLNSEINGARYSTAQIEALIELHFNQGQETTNENDKEACKVIEACMEEHLTKILNKCKEKHWNIGYMDLVFTGGGSELMRGFIESKGYIVSDNCIEDNVRGFYDLAVNYYAELEENLND